MTEKYNKARPWSEEDTKFLLEEFDRLLEEGLPKAQAYRYIQNQHYPDRTVGAISSQIYRARSQKESSTREEQEERDQKRRTLDLNKLTTEQSRDKFDPDTLLSQLIYLVRSTNLAYVKELENQRDQLEKKVESLEKSLKETEDLLTLSDEENKQYREKLRTLKIEYETLDEMINAWIKLGSVKKATSVQDFASNLKYQVDKFGRVVKVIN